jgi:hypothetical protein
MRASEQIVFPLEMRENTPNMQGNFHCLDCSDGSAAVIDAALYITLPGEKKPPVYTTELKTAYLTTGE